MKAALECLIKSVWNRKSAFRNFLRDSIRNLCFGPCSGLWRFWPNALNGLR